MLNNNNKIIFNTITVFPVNLLLLLGIFFAHAVVVLWWRCERSYIVRTWTWESTHIS